MCGIAGIISSEPGRFNHSTIKKMNHALAHRGPDGDSNWENPSGHVLFGHRRLSIIDLSLNGGQAMHYKNRYTIIYNGEIYNYVELKELLSKKGYVFKTQSDTEVILAAFDCYKISCLELFDGMFSFAIWDESEQTLFAARDRFGEKPFFYYYDETDRVLWFASEIKALIAAGIETSIDNEKLLMFIGAGYTETPGDKNGTFYRNIKQLPPAAFLIYQLSKKEFHIKEYWILNKEYRISITEEDAIEKFNELFTISVTRRLRSDVPLGTSLSGGLDSSAVAAKIFERNSTSIGRKSFSAIFPGFIKDESVYIEKITEAFNLERHTVTPTAGEFIRDLPLLMHHHEGPISSASVYLQYRVFELAKKHDVKILLDGQGADEILGGYTKYIHWHLQELLKQNKFSGLKSEKKSLRINEVPFEWGWKNYASALLPKLSKRTLEEKEITLIKRNSDIDQDFAFQNLNRDLISKPHVTKLNDILYFDTRDSGLGELLRYADRNSMAHGREVRLPFLNHELVEFVFSLPSSFKIHNGWTKWILRKSIEKSLPPEIVWRKNKVGFEPPQKSWMENKLVQDYIYECKRNLVKKKILRSSVLNKKIQPHDAYAADNLDWRYLVAGELLK
jgi:asparagine synthase (glutamine-hydrolysing)